MEVVALSHESAAATADAIVIGIWADGSLSPSGRQLDGATGGVLSGLIERKESTGKLYECTTLHAPSGVATKVATAPHTTMNCPSPPGSCQSAFTDEGNSASYFSGQKYVR